MRRPRTVGLAAYLVELRRRRRAGRPVSPCEMPQDEADLESAAIATSDARISSKSQAAHGWRAHPVES
jgi:hypothetical protein